MMAIERLPWRPWLDLFGAIGAEGDHRRWLEVEAHPPRQQTTGYNGVYLRFVDGDVYADRGYHEYLSIRIYPFIYLSTYLSIYLSI